jgi:NAD(P)-dependent dehydrogenase (short-subunit alcohol dehydrogenase family)
VNESADGFRERVIAITGAALGIGEALGRAFLERGAQLVALDRHWEAGSAWHAELQAAGALTLACDITDDAQVDSAFNLALARFGRIDVLVNNAAMRQRDLYPVAGASAVLDTQDADWERMFRVNVVGTLKVTRRFIRPMLARRRGSVINISANGSLTHDLGGGVSAGNHPGLLNQPYDATKAALTSLSFYLAEEVKASNVAVNVVFPGATRTTGSDALTAGREALGLKMTLLDAAHVLPVCLMLVDADAELTGRAYDVVHWNQSQGHAGPQGIA